MNKTIRKVADAVALQIKRHPLYYKKFNNTLDWRINQTYSKYAKECRESYTQKNGPLNLPPSPLFTDGVTMVKNAMDPKKAIAYSEKFSKLIDEKSKWIAQPKDYSDLQIRLLEPLKALDAGLMDVFENEEVHNTFLAFFGGHYRIEWVNTFRSVPANRKASSWLWHSDSFPPHTCKLFLHLTDATAETGATDFMSLQDTHAFRKAGYFGQYLAERYDGLEEFAKEKGLNYNPIHFDAAPGDATIFDMNFFHRAVSPKVRYRDVVQYYLMPNTIHWKEQFEKDGVDGMRAAHKGYPKDPRI